MQSDQLIIFALLLVTIVLFLSGRWRHDMVALGSLLGCVATGLVPPDEAFAGFGHPAVITVACVLVLSRAVQLSGAIDALAPRIVPHEAGPMLSVASLTLLAAVLSGFVNNVGALALLLPLAIQLAKKHELPPGRVLMPVAFGSILGGMTTMIGTPPNLIVAAFRAENGGTAFAMFDFTPVGAVVAAVGVIFVVATGRWLVPARTAADVEDFDTAAYLTEVRVADNSKLVGRPLHEVEEDLDELGAQVVGLIRREVRVPAPSPAQKLHADDILVIEAEPDGLATTLSRLRVKLEEAVGEEPDDEESDPRPAEAEIVGGPVAAVESTGASDDEEEENEKNARRGEDIVLGEYVVLPDSILAGRSATDVQLRTRFGINLLAVSRQGHRSMARLRNMAIRAGDVMLMQGTLAALSGFANGFGCVPLATRSLRIPDKRRAVSVGVIMVFAIAGAALGLVPASIGFAAGALAVMVLRCRRRYADDFIRLAIVGIGSARGSRFVLADAVQNGLPGSLAGLSEPERR